MTRTIALALLLCFAQFDGAVRAHGGCAGSGAYEYVCGLHNPEDPVAVPAANWVIASAMVPRAGLHLIDSRRKTWSEPYPGDVATARDDLRLYRACPGTPDAIEVFDVDATGARPESTWTGCVEMPHGSEANSVAAFDDGTLVATVLLRPGTRFEDSLAGRPTGAGCAWSPGDSGFTPILGTELPTNNVIEVSADRREIFVAALGLNTIVAFARDRIGVVEVD